MTDKDTNIPSTSLREHIASIIDATLEGKRFVVTRNGKPRVAIVSLQDLALLRAIEDADDLREIAKRKHEPLTPWEQVKQKLGIPAPETRATQARKAVRGRRAQKR